MSAIGEILEFIVYLILLIPPLCIIILVIVREKEFLKKGLFYLSVALIPLSLYTYSEYSNHREAELKYVGKYYLTNYPDCEPCVLILNKNNCYSVTKLNKELEQGKWRFRSGGDYWIVDIGEHGQLGTGEYRYNRFENNLKK